MAVRKFQDQLKLKKRKARWTRLGLLAGVVFLFLIGLAYLAFFAGGFDLRAVEVVGNQHVSGTQLLETIDAQTNEKWLLIIPRRNNRWLISYDQIAFNLLDHFPELVSVQAYHRTNHVLVVKVTERQPAGIWCLDQAKFCYFFDTHRTAYETTGLTEGYLFITIHDQRQQPVNLGETVMTAEWWDDIQKINQWLRAGSITPAYFNISTSVADEFTVHTDQGWDVLFSRATDLNKQTLALLKYLKTKLTPEERANLQYVNLRVPDRIYYK